MNRPASATVVSPRGGVRVTPQTAEESSGLIRRWLTRLCGAVLLLAVSGVLVQGGMYVSAKPVAHIVVEGEFGFVSREQIAARVYEALDTTFVKLDLNRMQQHLSEDPWLDRVSVTRRWPDTLVVRVLEQRPIARWGQGGFVNQRGEIIRPQQVTGLDDLPLLSGPDDQSLMVMTRYQVLSKLLRDYGLRIREVELSETLAWQLLLEDGVTVALGRDQVMEKVSRLLLVYRTHLSQRLAQVRHIDARYGNGIAVSWKGEA